jgi:predicted amidohydrolase
VHGPAHHAPTVQIDHHGQVQPTFAGPDVGEVGSPFAIRRWRSEVSLQQVGRDAVFRPLAHIDGRSARLRLRMQLSRAHQTRYPILAAALTGHDQVLPDAGRSIGVAAQGEELANFEQQACIGQ